MLSYSTWRAAARLPWVRENLDGLRYLKTTLYLLLALHRLGRRQDFQWTLRLFFEMAHSFAQYGRGAARETINGLFQIPWFFRNRRTLLVVIASYNRVRNLALATSGLAPLSRTDWEDVGVFIASLKEILAFDQKDEDHVRSIMADPGVIDSMISELHGLAHC